MHMKIYKVIIEEDQNRKKNCFYVGDSSQALVSRLNIGAIFKNL